MARVRSPTSIQYSKKLCAAVTVFWCIARLLGLAIVLLRPELGASMAGILQGVDDVMICNVGFYCGNSVAEKGIVSYFGAKRARAEAESQTVNDESASIENG